MIVISAPQIMQDNARQARQLGKRIAFVPTMGCLHEGHASLIRTARERCDHLVVSIFVNPLQFGPKEDFSRYPRTLEQDLSVCETAGVDMVFTPMTCDMYGAGFSTGVNAGELGERYCGKSRPGHFDGVLTVVAKLFNIVMPHIAFFGEKDFQQLFLINKMVLDLSMDTEVLGLPTVRESDGLALSSRNTYLSAELRKIAPCLFRVLSGMAERYQTGERSAAALLSFGKSIIQQVPEFTLDYLALVDERSLDEVSAADSHTRALVAAYVGDSPRVRLIDNMALDRMRDA